MRYALILRGRVNKIYDSLPTFHRGHRFEECPDHVEEGWVYNGGEYSAPVPVPDPDREFNRDVRAEPQVQALLAMSQQEIDEYLDGLTTLPQMRDALKALLRLTIAVGRRVG